MKKLASFLVGIILGWAAFSAAQTEVTDTKEKYAQAQKQNSAALQQWMWKSRTE